MSVTLLVGDLLDPSNHVTHQMQTTTRATNGSKKTKMPVVALQKAIQEQAVASSVWGFVEELQVAREVQIA